MKKQSRSAKPATRPEKRFQIISDHQFDIAPDDRGVAELLFSSPGITVLRGPTGYIVDREMPAGIPLNTTGEYAVPHTRELLSRELALHRILTTVCPDEFLDLLKPLAMELEIAHDITQANLNRKIV